MSQLLIVNGSVFTMDGQDTVHGPGWVWIEDGRIGAVGKGAPEPRFVSSSGRSIDATGMAVLPGLVNGHTHLAQVLIPVLLARLWADIGQGAEPLNQIIEQVDRLRRRWQRADGGRITVGFGPEAIKETVA